MSGNEQTIMVLTMEGVRKRLPSMRMAWVARKSDCCNETIRAMLRPGANPTIETMAAVTITILGAGIAQPEDLVEILTPEAIRDILQAYNQSAVARACGLPPEQVRRMAKKGSRSRYKSTIAVSKYLMKQERRDNEQHFSD